MASARVQREYPSTLRITVVERVPVVVKDYPDGPHLFDRDGVDFATAPPPPGAAVPRRRQPRARRSADEGRAEVMTALRPEVAGQVGRIAAPSVASITLTLTDGREVVWGTTDRTEEKALKLGALLTQPGPDLRRVQSGSADRQVDVRRTNACAENAREIVGAPAWIRPRRRPTVLVARNYLT